MKRFLCILTICCLTVSLFTGCARDEKTNPDGALSVYTSFYPMLDFAEKIGGDKISITNMVPAGTEPHDWEPTASDITGLEKADVFIYNGAGMEHWAGDILTSLKSKTLIVVEASEGISLLDGHAEEDGDADEEGSFDPHVWLSPMNAKKEMENIRSAFVQADPEHKDYYEANFEKYSAELDRLDQEFRDTLSPLANKDVIVAHQAFGYLCGAYGLNQVAVEGLSPDSEPEPARMAEIIAFAKERKIKTIFFEEMVSPKVAETIAEAVGADTQVLNPLEGLSDEARAAGEDYFSVMRQNLQALKSALQ